MGKKGNPVWTDYDLGSHFNKNQNTSDKNGTTFHKNLLAIAFQMDRFFVCFLFSPLPKKKKKTAVLPEDSIHFNFRHSITETSMLSNRILHIKSFYFSNTSHFGVVTYNFCFIQNWNQKFTPKNWWILELKHGTGKCQSRNVYKTINAENCLCFQADKISHIIFNVLPFHPTFSYILLLYFSSLYLYWVFHFDFRSVSLRTINFYDLQIFPQKIHLNDRMPVNIWQGVILWKLRSIFHDNFSRVVAQKKQATTNSWCATFRHFSCLRFASMCNNWRWWATTWKTNAISTINSLGECFIFCLVVTLCSRQCWLFIT